jgi:thiamine-phosphate pyrophosphorylase
MREDPFTLREHEARESIRRARLYGILDLGYVPASAAETMTRNLLSAGVHVLQLRAKNLVSGEIAGLGKKLSPICREAGVPFLLNDHPQLVEECEADGVHVGQDDLSVAAARALAGPHAIVGKSTHSLEQACFAEHEGADYIGFGPLFATPTKPDYVPIGLDSIREVHNCVSLPIFCIGGIKRENLLTVIEAGARRVVIVSGLLQAQDLPGMVGDCLNLLGKSEQDCS